MPIGSLRVTNNETIYELAETLFGRVTGKLNIMTSGPDARFPDDVVLTGTPDDMIFNGKNDLFCFSLKLFSQIAGVKSPILAATYAYLTEKGELITDIGAMLADILIDIVHDMLDDTKVLHNIYLMLPNATQAAIDGIGFMIDNGYINMNDTVRDLLWENLDVPAIIGKPGASMALLFKKRNQSDNLALPPMIDLKAGTFGFFKGTNATQTYWKINSGKYNLDQYQRVLEFNGNSR